MAGQALLSVISFKRVLCLSVVCLGTLFLHTLFLHTLFSSTFSLKTWCVLSYCLGSPPHALADHDAASNDTARIVSEKTPVIPSLNDRFLGFKEYLNDVLNMADPFERDIALDHLYRHWMQISPDHVLSVTQQMDHADIEKLVSRAILSWMSIDIQAVDAWLTDNIHSERLEPILSDKVLYRVLSADQAPEAFSMKWVEKIDDLAIQDTTIDMVLMRWAKKDPTQSLIWSVSTPFNEVFTPQLFRYIADNEITLAVESLSLLTKSQASTINQVSEIIKQRLPLESITTEIVTSIQRLPVDGMQEQVTQVLFSTLMNIMPVHELTQFLEALPASDARAGMQQQLTFFLARTDLAAAAHFAHALPSGVERENALREVMSIWQKQDISAASNWLASLNEDTDKAARSLVYFAVKSPVNLSVARFWVDKIRDKQIKVESTMALIASWYALDSAQALAYLNTQDIFSESEKVAYSSALSH